MDLDIENSYIQIIKRGKRGSTEGIELPNQECKSRRREKEIYSCIGILVEDNVKQFEKKEN